MHVGAVTAQLRVACVSLLGQQPLAFQNDAAVVVYVVGRESLDETELTAAPDCGVGGCFEEEEVVCLHRVCCEISSCTSCK